MTRCELVAMNEGALRSLIGDPARFKGLMAWQRRIVKDRLSRLERFSMRARRMAGMERGASVAGGKEVWR